MPICICSGARFASCVAASLFWCVGIAKLVEVVTSVFGGCW